MSNLDIDSVPAPTTDAPDEAEVRRMLEGSNDRLSNRADAADSDDADVEERKELRPPKDPNVVWLTIPSIPDQLQKLPHTVRTGPQTDAVFNLSDAAELQAFNLIQSQATDAINGQTAVIHHMDKKFHDGKFFALMTYSKLFYQQLQ